MRLYFSLFFLTLVLGPCDIFAAPAQTSTSTPTEYSQENSQIKKELQSKDETIVTSGHTEPDPIYDWSVRTGIISGVFTETREQKMYQFLGVRFDFFKKPYETWQGEVKLGNDNFVQATVGKKFPFALETVTSPYYKLSAGNLLGASEGIGSLLNIKKLQIIAAIGLDDFFLLRHRLQMEVAVSAAIIGPQLEFSLGYAF